MRADSRAAAAADPATLSDSAARGPERDPAAILIIDSDLSFAFWLGHALDNSGYVSLPAKDTRSAAELAEAHGLTIDLVVIDPLQRGAASFVSRLQRSFAGLKAVAAHGAEAEFGQMSYAYDAVVRKPAHRTPETAAEWVRLIRALSPRREGSSAGE